MEKRDGFDRIFSLFEIIKKWDGLAKLVLGGFMRAFISKRENSHTEFNHLGLLMANPVASGSGLFKFLRPSMRPQATDVQAAALWGITATTGALWFIQPFDWLKKTLFEKSDSEEK
ncbi:hypothetical protein Fot_03055 [Forsythia ovata]|uniref:Ubiquinol-cytochrome c reductase complex 6.7 kDa protein n=1 Tax=Forsythia ovata TaxID=205694 RepID=A0ABD1X8M1_9LAMI